MIKFSVFAQACEAHCSASRSRDLLKVFDWWEAANIVCVWINCERFRTRRGWDVFTPSAARRWREWGMICWMLRNLVDWDISWFSSFIKKPSQFFLDAHHLVRVYAFSHPCKTYGY
jgi:hypothetical protein